MCFLYNCFDKLFFVKELELSEAEKEPTPLMEEDHPAAYPTIGYLNNKLDELANVIVNKLTACLASKEDLAKVDQKLTSRLESIENRQIDSEIQSGKKKI